jgi:PAS domain S-box-containing protein
VAVVVTDLHGEVSYANRASDLLLEGRVGNGAPPGSDGAPTGDGGDAPGSAWRQRLAESGPVQRVLHGAPMAAEEVALDRRGAVSVDVELVAGQIVDRDRRVTHTASVLWDLTSLRTADRERAVLASIVDSTNAAIISVDRDGNITSWNNGAHLLYGYDSDEVLGAPVGILFPPSVDPGPSMHRALEGETVVYSEGERIHRDGSTLMVGETMSPVISPNGTLLGVASIARDIHDRLEAEEALARTQRELESRNRRLERSNADLEQFAYVASHDLSEPLRAVSGMVSLLARRYEGQLDEDADEFIEFAVEGCVRMREMIEDLLLYSRAGRVELERQNVDLGALVDGVTASLGPQIADADAVVEAGPLPVVRADESQMRQVLQNLISNAVKFRRPDRRSHVSVTAIRESDRWRIEIADNGIGIEEAYRERIFRMFQRLHPRETYPGTGIGLALVERIVDRHGGRVGITGNPAGGSTFWFTVPDTAEEAP